MLHSLSLIILLTITLIEHTNSLNVKFTRSASTPDKFTYMPHSYNNSSNLLLNDVRDITRARYFSTNINLKQAFRCLSVSYILLLHSL